MLHGIRIGDSAEEVEGLVEFSLADSGNPWKRDRTKDYVGHIVRPEDLGLTPAELASLSISSTRDRSLHVLFHEKRVVAVITTQRKDPSVRGIRVGSDSGKVEALYDERFQFESHDLPDGSHVEVRRYRTLGIGFETRLGKVVRMALFPPQ